jgi:hypothetical protein
MAITTQPTGERQTSPEGKTKLARLFFLDIADGRVLSVNLDGTDKKVVVTNCPKPDGIVVDTKAGHIYWTNMSNLKQNDGSIERADFDGKNRTR